MRLLHNGLKFTPETNRGVAGKSFPRVGSRGEAPGRRRHPQTHFLFMWRIAKIFSIVLFFLLLAAGGWYFFVPKPPLLEGVSFSPLVLDRNGRLLRLGLSEDEKYRIFTPLKNIAPEMVQATLLYEDRKFYQHSGVNFGALLRAFHSSYLGGGRRMGASTITMQTARLLYGLDTNSIPGKLRQIERAFALERHYSKDEILEAYLNLAPYGGNLEGCGAAARVYFHKGAASLNLSETLALVSVPQNPARRNPMALRKDADALQEARNRVFQIWLDAHPEDAGQKFLISAPLAVYGPKDLPFRAPHVSMEAVERFRASPGRYNSTIRTTIDANLQAFLENQLEAYLQRERKRNIKNLGAVLLHWPSMDIYALAGSADFYNPEISGQIDGSEARRSPGSTLKPFIYALALDQGLIHPKTLLYDTPRSFAGYDPENADQLFKGPLSATDALVQSRNIPAIQLAGRLKDPDLYEFLQGTGASLPYARDHYGLSLVLGGAEIPMRYLAALYAMLPNGGVFHEPRLYMRSGGRRAGRDAAASPQTTSSQTTSSGAASSVAVLSGAASSVAASSGTASFGGSANPFAVGGGGAPAGASGGVSPSASAGASAEGRRFFSAEAAALTLDMLKDNPTVQRVRFLGQRADKLPLYWKTGTSNGQRDAWTCGVFGPYVLVVWIGNFDNTPNLHFIGASAAAPLFLDIAAALEAREGLIDLPGQGWEKLNISRIPVCGATGDVNTALCPEVVETWFIPGVSPIADSGVYRNILLDEASGLRACVEEPGKTRRQVWEFWPTDLQQGFRMAGISKSPPPPFMPGCESTAGALPGLAPEIVTPKYGVVYQHSVSNPAGSVIPLTARGDADVTQFFWFSGSKFIGRAKPDESLLWRPGGGRHNLQVMDNFGRSSTRAVQVDSME